MTMPKEAGKPYKPLNHSVVQFITNETTEQYEATDFHEALLFAIAREIGRIHWNRYQAAWDRWSDDPHIPGIQWRQYIYECGCSEESDSYIPRHAENCAAVQPNFQFEHICFRWYKNPGRGMSINKHMPPEEWLGWFSRCLDKIREFDRLGFSESKLTPLPKADHLSSARCGVLYSKNPDSRMSDLDEMIKQADLSIKDKDFKKIVSNDDPELRPLFVLAVAAGIVAEKQRARDEDIPSAKAVSQQSS